MAECALLFVMCKHRYGALVDNPAWFMALFQRMVTSRFHDLSTVDSRHREVCLKQQPINVTSDLSLVLEYRAKDASKELKMVLYIIFNAPMEVLDLTMGQRRTSQNFFRAVVGKLGINKQKSNELVKELQLLLN